MSSYFECTSINDKIFNLNFIFVWPIFQSVNCLKMLNLKDTCHQPLFLYVKFLFHIFILDGVHHRLLIINLIFMIFIDDMWIWKIKCAIIKPGLIFFVNQHECAFSQKPVVSKNVFQIKHSVWVRLRKVVIF